MWYCFVRLRSLTFGKPFPGTHALVTTRILQSSYALVYILVYCMNNIIPYGCMKCNICALGACLIGPRPKRTVTSRQPRVRLSLSKRNHKMIRRGKKKKRSSTLRKKHAHSSPKRNNTAAAPVPYTGNKPGCAVNFNNNRPDTIFKAAPRAH